jgi:hypothetical protein
MGQAKNRKAEIAELKTLGANGKNFAIHFNFNIADEEDYRYSLLAVYKPETIKSIEANTYDNDKCFDIIGEHAQNLLVMKAGNADITDPKVDQQIKDSMRASALAVLRMAILDPYKNVVIQPNMVLELTLAESSDGRVGFNLIDDMPNSMLLAHKGVQNYIDSAKDKNVDFVVNL